MALAGGFSCLRFIKPPAAAAGCIMAMLIFRCPTTGKNVQAWLADEVSADNGESYESVTCLACRQMHFVNRATGKTLGEVDE
jgi:hypothetical protein